tara:strand:- start:3813 stop:4478 length:666 start_codon:yes stop_codon:yes gene_type:complete
MPCPISRISILILLGILLTIFTFDSAGQQRSVLEKKKGFRDIKLRSNVEDYDFLTLATEGGLSYDMEFLDIDQENVVSETRQFENVNTKYDEVDVYYVNPGTENYQTIDGGNLSKIFISTINSQIYKITLFAESQSIVIPRVFKTVYGHPKFSTKVEKGHFDRYIWGGRHTGLVMTAVLDDQKYRRVGYRIVYTDFKLQNEVRNLEKVEKQKKLQEIRDRY